MSKRNKGALISDDITDYPNQLRQAMKPFPFLCRAPSQPPESKAVEIRVHGLSLDMARKRIRKMYPDATIFCASEQKAI